MGRRIRRLVDSVSCTSKYVKNTLGIKASSRTIRNYMKNNEIKWQIFEKVIPVTTRNKQKRLDFSKEFLTNNINLKSVIFSDEKPFTLDGMVKNTFCWTIKRKKHKSVKRHSNGGTLMVWGAIDYNFKSDIVIIEGHLNSHIYKNILEHVQPILQSHNIFQHDNCPSHKANIINQWFNDNNINVINWPVQSPDLSIIENIWVEMEILLTRMALNTSLK